MDNKSPSSRSGKKTKSKSKTKSPGNAELKTDSSKFDKKSPTPAAVSTDSPKSGPEKTDSKKSEGDPSRTPAAATDVKQPTKELVSTAKSGSMGENLDIDGRDGIVAVVYQTLMAAFLFGGAAIFMAIDGHLSIFTATFCMALQDSKNDVCRNISSFCTLLRPDSNGTEWAEFGTAEFENVTDVNNDTNTSTINTTIDNVMSSTAIGAWLDNNTTIFGNVTLDFDQWFDCIPTLGLGGYLPDTFDIAIIFVLTTMTAIGYGNVVVTGFSAQAMLVIYSFFAIAIFLEFLNGLAATMCDQIAKLYDRLVRKRFLKKQIPEPAWMTNCPDLVPFSILFLSVAVYLIVVSGIVYKFVDFNSYEETLYFMFISVAMIGFGDLVPSTGLIMAMFFITIGIILMALVSVVQEEWLHHSVAALVDRAVGQHRPTEHTLESIMIPSIKTVAPKRYATLQTMLEGGLESKDRYRKKAAQTMMMRQFTVRFNVKGMDDDDSE